MDYKGISGVHCATAAMDGESVGQKAGSVTCCPKTLSLAAVTGVLGPMGCPSEARFLCIVTLVSDVIKVLRCAPKAVWKCPVLGMLVQCIHLE